MANAIRFYQTGDPEVMRWESVEVGEPGPGEARIRHVAVGLNFADTYFRTGLYPALLPDGLGVAAAGVVEAVGAGRVAGPLGATASPIPAARSAPIAPSG